ncbi:MAG: ATP-binding protein [Gemmatimonadota bacterium]|nr:ATP-binding protein [Gemmatimonadota bacterium]
MTTTPGNLTSPEFATALGRALAESDQLAIVVIDGALSVVEANPAARAALGSSTLSPGTSLERALLPEDIRDLREKLSHGSDGADPVLLRAGDEPTNPDRTLLAYVVPVDDGSEEARFVLWGRPAAAELEREARVLRARRYEIVGQLTSGIAHDLNNRLSTVTTFSDLLLGDAAPDSQDAEDLAEIKQAGLDSATITRKLDLFAGGHAGGESESSVSEVVRGFEKLLRRFLGETVTLVTELEADCPLVPAPPIRIEEMLIALVANARDAMPEGGTLTVTTRRANAGDGSRDAAVLEVHDTGTEDVVPPIERALEPFFSSKPSDTGSGLGLATVHGILTTLGGSIELDREGSEGTTVRITLPAGPTDDEGRLGESDESPSRTHGRDGNEPIHMAIVEPTDATRGALARGLGGPHTRITAAASVDELPRGDANLDAVVADVPAHRGAGKTLLGALRELEPGVPVVLLRRRASPRVISPDAPGVLELPKPTDLGSIRAAVRQVTGSRTS